MTTTTTIIALLPIMWSTTTGSEVMKPMAIPTLGGMLVELITLFIVPVTFSYFEQRKILNEIKKVETNNLKLVKELETQEYHLTNLYKSILEDAVKGKLTTVWRKKNQKTKKIKTNLFSLLQLIRLHIGPCKSLLTTGINIKESMMRVTK
mgnify:CR=1 FL=1